MISLEASRNVGAGPKMATAPCSFINPPEKEAGFFIRPLATGIYLINRKFRLVSVLSVKSFHDFPGSFRNVGAGPKMATGSVFLHQSAQKRGPDFSSGPLATGIYLINRKFRLVSVLFVKSFHDFPGSFRNVGAGPKMATAPCSFINPSP